MERPWGETKRGVGKADFVGICVLVLLLLDSIHEISISKKINSIYAYTPYCTMYTIHSYLSMGANSCRASGYS